MQNERFSGGDVCQFLTERPHHADDPLIVKTLEFDFWLVGRRFRELGHALFNELPAVVKQTIERINPNFPRSL